MNAALIGEMDTMRQLQNKAKALGLTDITVTIPERQQPTDPTFMVYRNAEMIFVGKNYQMTEAFLLGIYVGRTPLAK